MSIKVTDKTGSLPTANDANEAIAVIEKYMLVVIGALPPELLVQLPNIRRCLQAYAAVAPTLQATLDAKATSHE